jgi:hypothetical protein
MNTLRGKVIYICYTTNTFTTVINIYFSWGEVYLGLQMRIIFNVSLMCNFDVSYGMCMRAMLLSRPLEKVIFLQPIREFYRIVYQTTGPLPLPFRNTYIGAVLLSQN